MDLEYGPQYEEYKKEEALIREQNRAKLSHVKDSYYRKAKEALDALYRLRDLIQGRHELMQE